MLHRSCDFSTVRGNKVHDNMDSGVALYESSNCEVSNNDIYGNKSESVALCGARARLDRDKIEVALAWYARCEGTRLDVRASTRALPAPVFPGLVLKARPDAARRGVLSPIHLSCDPPTHVRLPHNRTQQL